jgi:hypothetical protein
MKGYRKLRVGEIVRRGDVWATDDRTPCHYDIGKPYMGRGKIGIYRPIPPKPSAVKRKAGKVLGKNWWALCNEQGSVVAMSRRQADLNLLSADWTIKRVAIVEAK